MITHEHRHLRLADSRWIWHVHGHTCGGEGVEWNGLHHHPPAEHDGLTDEALASFRVGEVERMSPARDAIRQVIAGIVP